MKRSISILILLFLVSLTLAQDTQKDEWIRVQSDDGEFSIEVPAKYGFYSDREGTMVKNYNIEETLIRTIRKGFTVSEMDVFNAYAEHTLLSFESYKAPYFDPSKLDLVNAFESTDEGILRKLKFYPESNLFRNGDTWLKQAVFDTTGVYTVRIYFCSKKYIYVLTASSRNGQTPAMKRFFGSLKIDNDAKGNRISKDTRFSSLKTTSIVVEDDPDNTERESSKTSSDPTIKPFLMVVQPIAPSMSRDYSSQGKARLKVVFSEIGQITKVILLEKNLESRLRRNIILTALRCKYLPEESNDQPVALTRIIKFDYLPNIDY